MLRLFVLAGFAMTVLGVSPGQAQAQDTTLYTVTYVEVGPVLAKVGAGALHAYRSAARKDAVSLDVYQRIDRPNQFVVLAAWSLGTFFAWSGLLLLCAAVAHTVAVRPRRRAALITAWFLMGGTGLCALFLAYHHIAARLSGGQTIEGPLIVAGSWVFAGLVGLLAIERSAGYLVRRVPRT